MDPLTAVWAEVERQRRSLAMLPPRSTVTREQVMEQLRQLQDLIDALRLKPSE